jgi:predicted hydrocarbon binding protein
MNARPIPTYRYPDQMGKILFLAMQEVIGCHGVGRILNAANLPQMVESVEPDSPCKQLRFDQISRIQSALEDTYGLQGGQGIALRCGRASFKYGLREFGERSGWTDLEFRLLPLHARVQAGAELMVKALNDNNAQNVRVTDQGERFVWEIERCPVCWGRHANDVSCHLTVGILQESLYWVSGGKFYNVQETHCIAKGDPACTIVVNKKPLD